MATEYSAYKRGSKSVGGIKKVYLINKDEREASDLVLTVTDGALVITGTADVCKAWEVTPKQNSFNFTQPEASNNDNNTGYVTQTLGGFLDGYSAAVTDLVNKLRLDRSEVGIEFKNGTFIVAGIEENGLQSSGGDGGASGQAMADANGYDLLITCESKLSAPTCVKSNFTDLFQIITPA